MDWEPNPPRGCGRKRQGFYLESGPGSAWGRLNLVTMCTGDLKIGGENILCEIPPRGVQKFAPIDTFRMGEVCFDTAHAPTPNNRQDIYEIVRNGTKPWGLIDHVGSNRYSPVSFIKELHEYGASRRVPEELAKEVAGLMGMGFVAIPMFFTHSRIPFLQDGAEFTIISDAATLAYRASGTSHLWTDASYTHPRWGMRVERWNGVNVSDPALAWYILNLAEAALESEEDSVYAHARPLFENCRYHEQLLCATWIRQVTYATADGKVPAWTTKSGVSIIDIREEGEGEEE